MEMESLIRSRLCELWKAGSCSGIWDDMKVTELRKECKAVGVRVKGKKTELSKRLNDWRNADDNESLPSSSTASSPDSQQDTSDEESRSESNGPSPAAPLSKVADQESSSVSETNYDPNLAPPDKRSIIHDKLECCQMVLHPSFNKDQLSKSAAKSVVAPKEDDIMDFMTKSIETGMSVDGMTIPSPGFVYICGGPGTGKVSHFKFTSSFLAPLHLNAVMVCSYNYISICYITKTAAVASCKGKVMRLAKQNGYEKPSICIMNMAKPGGKDGIMRDMQDKMARALGLKKGASISKIEKKMKKKALVLVLDEIDMLFENHGRFADLWFKNPLIGWAEDKELRFSMIGISNCVNDTKSRKIRELGHVSQFNFLVHHLFLRHDQSHFISSSQYPHELVFSAYREVDILAILQQRVGNNVIGLKVLQLISRRVAAGTGDARCALKIASNAAGKCIDMMSDDKLETKVKPDDECMPLVKLPHVMRAIKEGMPMPHDEVIAGLPQAAKVILCICVSLSQVWGPTAEINIPTLKKYCVEATQHTIMDELGLGHIMNLAEMLVDAGLLVTGNRRGFNKQNPNAKLKIGIQLEEVEIALEETLLKEGGFYASLVEYVKRECPQ